MGQQRVLETPEDTPVNCSGCGAEIPVGANACPACGRPVMLRPPPPPAGSSRVTTPVRRAVNTTVNATRNVASDAKKTGKAAIGEAKLAVQDVRTLTRQAVDELGKGLEDVGKELQKAGKKNK
jgi:hypothetical protein